MTPLWLGAALPVATAALLTYVGVLVARRPSAPEAALALRMFAVWWICAALVVLLASMPTLLSLAGLADVAVLKILSTSIAAPLALGLCGLLYYLIYIYTGKRKAIWPLAVAYGAFFVYEIFYFNQSGPRHLETSAFAVRAISDDRPATWMRVVFGVAVGGPILAAIVAYASLYPKTREKAARRRIAMVSAAFAIWFLPVLLAIVLDRTSAVWFPLVYQLPGVLAALVIVRAYQGASAWH